MKEFLLFASLVLIGLFACTKKIKTVEDTPKSLTPEEKAAQLANTTFQKDYQIQFNQSKTVACISKAIKRRPNDIFSTLTFLLYHPETEKILFKETIPRATGKWLNDQEFEVTTTPGRVGQPTSENNKPGFVFDVVKITKQERNNF